MKVLILESNAGLRNALQGELQNLAHDVSIVGTVRQALTCLSESAFDAVSLDLRAPGYCGLPLIEKLRERKHNLPIIATADIPAQGEIRNLQQFGAHFVKKPYGVASVVRISAQMLGIKADRRGATEEATGPIEDATKNLKPQLRVLARETLSQGTFPVLDQRAAELQRLMSEDDCSIDALVRLLEGDIHLTASILSRANNAASRGASQFTTLREACVRIGTRDTFAVALRTLLENTFPVKKEPYRTLVDEFWKTARTRGVLSRRIALHKNMEGAEELYVAGLLSNVGELFTAWLMSQHHQLLAHCDRAFIEKEVSAMASRLGPALLQRWQLPVRLTSLITPGAHLPQEELVLSRDLLRDAITVVDATRTRMGQEARGEVDRWNPDAPKVETPDGEEMPPSWPEPEGPIATIFAARHLDEETQTALLVETRTLLTSD